jgi:hypothetical protein
MASSGPSDVLVTYRYLRLAIIILVCMLSASVVIQWEHLDRNCLERSISAYYYTPARPVLVATMVSIGVCMIALRGSTEAEDILLNFAGMFAFIVAFVPSPPEHLCEPVPTGSLDRAASIYNNISSLFVAGVVVMVAASVMAFHTYRKRRLTRGQLAGLALAWVTLAAGFAWFRSDRGSFESAAHYTASALLFITSIAVVVSNAVQYAESRWTEGRWPAAVNRYSVLAVAMILLPTSMWLYYLVGTWDHAPLFIEWTLILLFGIFWVLQTQELWTRRSHAGLPRAGLPPPDPPDPSDPAQGV